MRRPSVSTIIATVALFFALAGTGVAATHWLITSTNQIKPSVRAALRGNRGPRGFNGFSGSQGPQGPNGVANLSTVSANGPDAVLAPSGVGSSVAECPAGTTVTGGGWSSTGTPMVDGSVAYNYALGNGWAVIAVNNEVISADFYAVAQCIGGGAGASVAHSTVNVGALLAKQVAAVKAAQR